MAANVTYPTVVRYIGKGDPFQKWLKLQRFTLGELLRSPSAPISTKRERVMSLTAAVYNLFKVIGRQNPRVLRRGMNGEFQAAANRAFTTKEPQSLARISALVWKLLLELDSAVKRSNVRLNLVSRVTATSSSPVITEIVKDEGVSWDDIKEHVHKNPQRKVKGLSWEDIPFRRGRIKGMASKDDDEELLDMQEHTYNAILEAAGINSKFEDGIVKINVTGYSDEHSNLWSVLEHAMQFANTGVLLWTEGSSPLPYLIDVTESAKALAMEVKEKYDRPLTNPFDHDDWKSLLGSFCRIKKFYVIVHEYTSTYSFDRSTPYGPEGETVHPSSIDIRKITNILYDKETCIISLGVLPSDKTKELWETLTLQDEGETHAATQILNRQKKFFETLHSNNIPSHDQGIRELKNCASVKTHQLWNILSHAIRFASDGVLLTQGSPPCLPAYAPEELKNEVGIALYGPTGATDHPDEWDKLSRDPASIVKAFCKTKKFYLCISVHLNDELSIRDLILATPNKMELDGNELKDIDPRTIDIRKIAIVLANKDTQVVSLGVLPSDRTKDYLTMWQEGHENSREGQNANDDGEEDNGEEGNEDPPPGKDPKKHKRDENDEENRNGGGNGGDPEHSGGGGEAHSTIVHPPARRQVVLTGPGRDQGCILQVSGDAEEELVDGVLQYVEKQQFVVFVITNIAKGHFRKVDGAFYVVPPAQALRLLPDWAWKHANIVFVRTHVLTDAIRLRLQKAKRAANNYGTLYPKVTIVLGASEHRSVRGVEGIH